MLDVSTRAPADPPVRPRRADYERNLVRIIEAATEVLADQPMANMTEIARASGLVRATLYRHFPTREDLLVAICRDALARTEEAIAAADPASGPAPEALARVIDHLAIVGDRYRVVGSGAIDMRTDAELMALAYRIFKPVNELVQRGQREGTLRADMSDTWIVAAIAVLVTEGTHAVVRGDFARKDVATHVRRFVLEPLVVG